MFKIRDIEINSPIIVAPMAGISNDAFKDICFEFGIGLFCYEMVSDKAVFYHNKRTLDMLNISNNNHPIALQIFGKDEDTMIYAAKVLDNETNCDIIDINMGCPVNKVVKTGAGSALMKDEDNTVSMIKKLVKAVKKPITVKMRIGWDLNSINCLSLAKKLEDVGVSAIALHARSRSQMYEGKADWSYIKLLKDNLRIPVIGNGDVKSVDDFIRMKEETNCDGIMLARALVGNPFLLKQINNYLNNQDYFEINDYAKLDYCLKHCQKLINLTNEKIAISQMRGLAPHYISGIYNATKYKARMNSMKTYDDLIEILNAIKDEIKNRIRV